RLAARAIDAPPGVTGDAEIRWGRGRRRGQYGGVEEADAVDIDASRPVGRDRGVLKADARVVAQLDAALAIPGDAHLPDISRSRVEERDAHVGVVPHRVDERRDVEVTLPLKELTLADVDAVPGIVLDRVAADQPCDGTARPDAIAPAVLNGVARDHDR